MRWIGLTLFIPCVATMATAAPPNRYVVIVANNATADASAPPLRFADDDGVVYYQLLAPHARQIALLSLLDQETQARFFGAASIARPPTRKALATTLADFYAAMAKERDSAELLFIYVGHGGLDPEGRGFVHLQDGLFTRADLFRDVIEASPARFTHIIIDACNAFSLVAGRGAGNAPAAAGPSAARAAADAEGPSLAEAADDGFARFLSGHELERYPNVGVIAVTTDSNETHEWTQIQAGVFSFELRSALAGAADVNNDGRVEYSEAAAFVEAANAEVEEANARLTVFAWPPRRDGHAALVDLDATMGARYVVLGAGLAGRFFLESSGARFAELHKQADTPVILALPDDEDFYCRDGEREELIEAGADTVVIAEPPSTPYALATRGSIGRALSTGLFAVPFGPIYYRGYVAGRPSLLGVRASGPPFLTEAQAPARSRWRLGMSYSFGTSPLSAKRLEHGAAVEVERALLGDEVALRLGLETGLSDLHGLAGESASRVGLTPGIVLRTRLGERLILSASVEVGLAAIFVGGESPSRDWTVGTARLFAGGELRLVADLALGVAAGPAAYVVSVGDREQVGIRPELRATLSWQP